MINILVKIHVNSNLKRIKILQLNKNDAFFGVESLYTHFKRNNPVQKFVRKANYFHLSLPRVFSHNNDRERERERLRVL